MLVPNIDPYMLMVSGAGFCVGMNACGIIGGCICGSAGAIFLCGYDVAKHWEAAENAYDNRFYNELKNSKYWNTD